MDISDSELDILLKKYKVLSPIGPTGWKEAGNALISKKEYKGAVKAYSKGLELGTDGNNDLLCILLSNRAQAYLGMNEFLLALLDADEAIKADSGHMKSYFRKGRALFELGRYEEACEAFKQSDGQSKMVQQCLDRMEQSKEGKYAWMELLQQTIKDPESQHGVADFISECVKVEEVEGHGRGVVAVQDIEKGSLVLVEKACVFVGPTAIISKRKAPGELAVTSLLSLMDSDRKLRAHVLDLDLGADCEFDRGEESYVKNKEMYLRRAVSMNGFGWWDGTKANIQQRPQDHGFGLWSKACMFNHSCVPNCCYGFLGNLLVVRAAVDIKAGDELMISYLSAHDVLEERDMKLKKRGFKCQCLLCEKQRAIDWDEYNSARGSVFRDFGDGKAVQNSLTWHALVKMSNDIDDLNVSAVVARIVGGLSCDRTKDYGKAVAIWEEAWNLQTSQPEMTSLWTEEVNFCVQAIFSGIMTQNKDVAESWIPKLDQALGKMFPKDVVQGLGNFLIVAFRTQKQAEEQGGGPGIQSMLGF